MAKKRYGKGELVPLKSKGEVPGSWTRDGEANPPNLSDTSKGRLDFVMDREGKASGIYKFTPDPPLQAGSTTQSTDPETVCRRRWPIFMSKLSRFMSKFFVPTALALVVFAGIIYVIFWVRLPEKSSAEATFRAYAFAVATLVFVLVLLSLAAKGAGKPGLGGLIQGADLRTSTSKTQYLLWTFGIAFALAKISGYSLLTGSDFTCPEDSGKHIDCLPTENWEVYLVLLGVPAASAVIAKGVTSYKVQNGIVQKTDASPTTTSVANAATNDDGSASLVDSQYLIFNAVAFVYVAVGFVQTGTFVKVPAMILGLTSAAAGTYVLNKSLQTNKPSITSIVPSTVTTGGTITIKGVNLFPPGSAGAVGVKVGGKNAENPHKEGNDVVCVIPEIAPTTDLVPVSVTTSANIETETYDIRFAAPKILGLTKTPAAGETTVGLFAQGLTQDSGAPGTKPQPIYVQVNGQLVKASFVGTGSLTESQVSATVDALKPGPVRIQVRQAGAFSPEFVVTVP